MSNRKMDDLMENIVMSDGLKDKIRENTIDKGKVKKFKAKSYKRVALVACLCVAMLGTMTVATVANVDKIENYFAKLFGFDEKEYKELVEDGFVQNTDVATATKQGVTISIKETIADKSNLMVLYCVKYEDAVDSEDRRYAFESFEIEGISSGGTRTRFIEGGNEAEGEYWYALNIDCEDNEITDGKEIGLVFENLVHYSTGFDKNELYKIGDDGIVTINGEQFEFLKLDVDSWELIESIAEPGGLTFLYDEQDEQYVLKAVNEEQSKGPVGNVELIITEAGDKYVKVQDKTEEVVIKDKWSVQWEVTANETIAYISVNDTVDANGYRYYMDEVRITPFSLKVNFSDSAEIIDEQYVLDNMDMDTYTEMMKKYEDIKKENKELYYSVFDFKYFSLDIKLIMKDGTEYKMSDMDKYAIGNGGEWYRLKEHVDVESIEKVIIEGKEYFVNK